MEPVKAWALKDLDGEISAVGFNKKEMQDLIWYGDEKIIRVEIREVRKKK